MRLLHPLALVVFFILIVPSLSWGQEITQKHAGVLFSGSYDEDFNLSHSASVQIAGEVRFPILWDSSKIFMRGSWNSTGKALCQFWIEQVVVNNFIVSAGFFGRPIAQLHRPSPVSPGNQFEPPALAIIPESSTGILANIKLAHLAHIFSLYPGIYYVPAIKSPEINLGIKINPLDGISLRLAGYVNKKNRGGAITIETPVIRLTEFYESDRVHSLFAEGYTPFGDPYYSGIYDRTTKKLTSSEVGWSKTWDVGAYKTLAGFGYETVQKSFNVYLWVHI